MVVFAIDPPRRFMRKNSSNCCTMESCRSTRDAARRQMAMFVWSEISDENSHHKANRESCIMFMEGDIRCLINWMTHFRPTKMLHRRHVHDAPPPAAVTRRVLANTILPHRRWRVPSRTLPHLLRWVQPELWKGRPSTTYPTHFHFWVSSGHSP